MNGFSYTQLKSAVLSKGFQFFDTGDYNLNIIGIRAEDLQSNAFNDLICVLFTVNGQQMIFQFEATTDPGTSHRVKPINAAGIAALVEGQHKGAFQLGMHQGRYRALVQARALSVYRDSNDNAQLDLAQGSVERGWFGINLHRASEHRRSIQVDNWSLGCQVIADPLEYDLFIDLCEIAAERWGNRFTYTLLKEQDITGQEKA